MTDVKEETGHTLRAGIDISLEAPEAFDTIVDGLETALADAGMRFEPGPGGSIAQGGVDVGSVLSWERGKKILFRWNPATWMPGEVTELEIRFEGSLTGTHVTLEQKRWGRILGDEIDVAGWFAAGVVSPIMKAMSPEWLGDWITDRRARRPSGSHARSFYRDPLYHYPGFRALLAEMALSGEDRLLEVGCGGGVLLKQALACGCTGAGVDHSPAMVRLAREANRDFLRSGRLEILEGTAEKLPLPDDSFTCATMSGVFGFIDDPVAALKEIKRVLRPGGRIVIMGSDPAMRGTPAAPEPMASRIHFYTDNELEALARSAGFGEARVVRPDLGIYAREAGIPEEHISLFGPSPLLLARKIST